MSFSSKKIESYSDIINKYQVFVFDLCGVVHNGIALHEGTVRFIDQLRHQNKEVIFLSNSPNSSLRAINHLKKDGFELAAREKLHTSGDYFINLFSKNKLLQSKKYYFFGKEYNGDFLAQNGLQFVDNPEVADVIIASPFSSDQQEINDFVAHTKDIVRYKLPLFCVNPDIYAPHGDELRYTPGYFAKIYAEHGGEVRYFGKPESSIYEFVLADLVGVKNINKDKILMVGDSMNTDVRGAKNYQIHSLLVGSGYHQNIDFADAKAIDSLFDEFGFAPNYYITGPNF